ncbi:MAG TPA: class I SAM-dependent methyltransferase, partial [Pseudonocardiaceae bacterium]|nr:class I SAM-dependent methyltransferase [Pseudonocardiaceae bacterium]
MDRGYARSGVVEDPIGSSTTPRRLRLLLAAGMDTRAYRLDLPATTTVFELDRPELLRLKNTLLTGTSAPRCTRRPVGIDLAGNWVAAL